MTHLSSMRTEELPAVLVPLGFTETEALVYGELLRQPDQTGYKLSKTIGKGQPVTYAALAGLASKGAVIASIAPARAYRAVPPAELLGGLRRTFDEKCAVAKDMLSKSEVGPASDQLFQLKTRRQVFERARSMIREASSTILYELWPVPASELRAELEAAAGRQGLAVAGLVLHPQDVIDRVRTVVPTRAAYMQSVWKEQIIVLIADSRQVLIAQIGEGDEVFRAIWTDNPILAVVLHNAVTSDVLLHEKMPLDWVGPNRDLFGKLPPGFTDLTGGV